MKYFSAGFLGTVTNECLEYAVSQVESAQTIIVPFTGSGKDVAALSCQGRTIYSWDTQEATRLLIAALQCPWQPKIDSPKGYIGWARENFPFTCLDEGTARLMNYIAQEGGVHDKAALVKTIVQCTVMGRLGQWASSNEGYRHFWTKFERARNRLEEWADRPGTIVHSKGDYFTSEPPDCDVIYVDPPKVIARTDVYSGKAYLNLNSILEQRQAVQPVWTVDGYLERIHATLSSTHWRRALVFYVSGLIPTQEALLGLDIMRGHKPVVSFIHGDRLDHVIVLDR